MGLDDCLFDSGLKAIIIDLCKKESILTCYSNFGVNIGGKLSKDPRTTVSDENLDKWEATICYNGYSTIFHMLYPLVLNMRQGASPNLLTAEQKAQVRNALRKELLTTMKEYTGSGEESSDDNNGQVTTN